MTSKQPEQAIKIFDEMQSIGVQPNDITYIVLVSGCTANKKLIGTALERVPKESIIGNVKLATCAIQAYSDLHDIDAAIELFYSLKEVTHITYIAIIAGCTANARFDIARQLAKDSQIQNITSVELTNTIITMYCKSGDMDEALKLYSRTLKPNEYTFSTLIAGCSNAGLNERAQELHRDLESYNVPMSVELTNALVQMYCKSGKFDIALELVQSSKQVDSRTFAILINGYSGDVDNIVRLIPSTMRQSLSILNARIQAYCKTGRINDAWNIFSSSVQHDSVSYVILLSGCHSLQEYSIADKVVEKFEESSVPLTKELGTCIIQHYCSTDRIDDAWTMYRKLSSRFELESRTHTVMIAGCTAAGKFDYADIVCQEAKQQDIELLNVIMKLYCYSNRFPLAMKLFKQNLHKATASTYSIMIAGCNANSAWNDMDNIVKHMEDTAFTVQGRVATALIAAYFKRNQPERAYELYYHMRAKNTHIDLATYTQLLSHVSSPSFNFALEEEILHEEMPTVTQKHILILCYARRDDHESAMKVFESMEKNVENLSVILQAHSICGKGIEAVEALNAIIQLGVSPSSDAYVSALSACSRSAMMEEGEKIFEMLKQTKQLKESHIVAMVDLYARTNNLDKAENLASQVKSKVAIAWTAVLGGCKLYGDMNRAERVILHIKNQPAAQILMANIYASLEMWDERNEIREILNMGRLEKIPGISYGRSSEGSAFVPFYVEDPNVLADKEVMDYLTYLRNSLQEQYGYVVDVSCVLRYFETHEEKVMHLWSHSEKLALAVALLRTKGKVYITKNLRMCGDCHHATCLISKFMNREIVITDQKRNHTFKNGVCTCGGKY